MKPVQSVSLLVLVLWDWVATFWDTAYARVKLRLMGCESKKNLTVAGSLRCRNAGCLSIGANVRVNGGPRRNVVGGGNPTSLEVRKGASLQIGDHTGISSATIVATTKIEIGCRVLIGGGCHILDSDFHGLYGNRDDPRSIRSAPIVIEDDVFIGCNCIVLKGSRIRKGAVIGAGSIVTGEVPAYEIWSGVPARFNRSITE
jgi:acetyltransferase-like isoleucine patch superfamily enzyme